MKIAFKVAYKNSIYKQNLRYKSVYNKLGFISCLTLKSALWHYSCWAPFVILVSINLYILISWTQNVCWVYEKGFQLLFYTFTLNLCIIFSSWYHFYTIYIIYISYFGNVYCLFTLKIKTIRMELFK